MEWPAGWAGRARETAGPSWTASPLSPAAVGWASCVQLLHFPARCPCPTPGARGLAGSDWPKPPRCTGRPQALWPLCGLRQGPYPLWLTSVSHSGKWAEPVGLAHTTPLLSWLSMVGPWVQEVGPRPRDHPTVGRSGSPSLLSSTGTPGPHPASLLLPCRKPLWPGSAQLEPRGQSFHTGRPRPSVASLPILEERGTPGPPTLSSSSQRLLLRYLHCGQGAASTGEASCRAQARPQSCSALDPTAPRPHRAPRRWPEPTPEVPASFLAWSPALGLPAGGAPNTAVVRPVTSRWSRLAGSCFWEGGGAATPPQPRVLPASSPGRPPSPRALPLLLRDPSPPFPHSCSSQGWHCPFLAPGALPLLHWGPHLPPQFLTVLLPPPPSHPGQSRGPRLEGDSEGGGSLRTPLLPCASTAPTGQTDGLALWAGIFPGPFCPPWLLGGGPLGQRVWGCAATHSQPSLLRGLGTKTAGSTEKGLVGG